MKQKVTVVASLNDATNRQVDMSELAAIAADKRNKRLLDSILDLIAAGHGKEHDDYDRLKKQLSPALFSVLLGSDDRKDYVHHTGFVAFDIEHKAPTADISETEELRKVINRAFKPVLSYISPRQGLRYILKASYLAGAITDDNRTEKKHQHKAFYSAHAAKACELIDTLGFSESFEFDKGTNALNAPMFAGTHYSEVNQDATDHPAPVEAVQEPQQSISLHAAPDALDYSRPIFSTEIPDRERILAALQLIRNNGDYDQYADICAICCTVGHSDLFYSEYVQQYIPSRKGQHVPTMAQFEAKCKTFSGQKDLGSLIYMAGGWPAVLEQLRKNGAVSKSVPVYEFSAPAPEAASHPLYDDIKSGIKAPEFPSIKPIANFFPPALICWLAKTEDEDQRNALLLSFFTAISSITRCTFHGSDTQMEPKKCNLLTMFGAPSSAGKGIVKLIPSMLSELQPIRQTNKAYNDNLKALETIEKERQRADKQGRKPVATETIGMLTMRDNPLDHMERFTMNALKETSVFCLSRIKANGGYGLSISTEAGKDLVDWVKVSDSQKSVETIHLHAGESETEDHGSNNSGDLTTQVNIACMYASQTELLKRKFFNQAATTAGMTTRFMIYVAPGSETSDQRTLASFYGKTENGDYTSILVDKFGLSIDPTRKPSMELGDIKKELTKFLHDFSRYFYFSNATSPEYEGRYTDPRDFAAKEADALEHSFYLPKSTVDYFEQSDAGQLLSQIVAANSANDSNISLRDRHRIIRIYLLLCHLAIMEAGKVSSHQLRQHSFKALKQFATGTLEDDGKTYALIRRLFLDFATKIVLRCAHDRELLTSTHRPDANVMPLGEEFSALGKMEIVKRFFEHNPSFKTKPAQAAYDAIKAQMKATPSRMPSLSAVKQEHARQRKSI